MSVGITSTWSTLFPSLWADRMRKTIVRCASCNLAKSDRMSGLDPITGEETALFHPRVQTWHEHFRWAADQRTLIGLTTTGRTTIVVLDMNSTLRQDARELWFLTKNYRPGKIIPGQ
jgi:hypothetical protein